MIDDQMVENLEYIGDKSDAAKLFYEFKYRTVMEAATKLTQFALIFLTISSVITSATIFNDFNEKAQQLVFYCVIVMVFVFIVIGASIVYGVIAGLVQIKQTLRSLSPETYTALKMDAYFRRGIRVLAIVSFASVAGVVAIIMLIATYR